MNVSFIFTYNFKGRYFAFFIFNSHFGTKVQQLISAGEPRHSDAGNNRMNARPIRRAVVVRDVYRAH